MPCKMEIKSKNHPSAVFEDLQNAGNCNLIMYEWCHHDLDWKNVRKMLILQLIHIYGVLSDNVTWWSCSTHEVLQHHKDLSNSDEKQTHLTDGPSVKGRWIQP